MLSPAPSETANQPQLTVVYNYSPVALLSAYARLLLAKNPSLASFPDALDPTRLLGVDSSPGAISVLEKNILIRAETGIRALPSPTGRVGDVGASALDVFISWLSIGGSLSFPKLPLDNSGSKQMAAARSALDVVAKSPAQSWNDEAVNSSVAVATLVFSFEKIWAAPYLTGEVDEVPDGVDKILYGQTVRARRALALLAVLKWSVNRGELRERAAFFASPIIQPVLELAAPSVLEDIKGALTYAGNLKVHPWYAESERMRVPASRYTSWAPGSATLGAATGGLYAQLLSWHGGKRESTQEDLTSWMLEDQLPQFLRDVEEHKTAVAAFNGADVAQAEGIFGLTLPSSPAPVFLHGNAFRHYLLTGDHASAPASDILSLMTAVRYPRASEPGDKGTHTSGGLKALMYESNTFTRDVPDHLRSSTNIPPVFVTPARPDVDPAHVLLQLGPTMLQPVAVGSYWGDTDADFFPYTAAGAADALGKSSWEELPERHKKQLLETLFTLDSSGQVIKSQSGDRLYYSTRTRQPWLRPVYLPDALVTSTLAMSGRTAPIERPVYSIVNRTPSYPEMNTALRPMVDLTVRKAAVGLGTVVADKE